MGTSASTQQDVSPVTNSTLHSIPSLPSSVVQSQRQYSGALALNIESLETNAMLQHQLSTGIASAHSDGYKWRKYGQKSVKGSEYPRNYYKCTFPGCTVKKYVEKNDEEGKNLEKVTYKGGEHTHDPSRVTRLNATDQTTFKQSVLNEGVGHQDLLVKPEPRSESLEITDPNTVVGLHNDTSAIFPTSPRLVVETTADIDHNDDGYSWRKYGQKNVKGSSYPTPRSYYRCTQEDCPVKKQVEQRGNIIYNTYEGTHNHLAPGWDEVKKKRKINRSSSLMNRVIDETKKQNGNESSQEITDKTIEEGEANTLPKSFHPEEALSLVIAEAAIHQHPVEARSLIPLQDLNQDSALASLPISSLQMAAIQMVGNLGLPIPPHNEDSHHQQ